MRHFKVRLGALGTPGLTGPSDQVPCRTGYRPSGLAVAAYSTPSLAGANTNASDHTESWRA
eukprot:768459-Hanusia_phi.AAC.4